MCSKNPINKDTKQKNEGRIMPSRLEDVANMEVDAGSFLKIDNGYSFIFQIPNPMEQELPEVEKTFEGKKAGTKIQWRVLLKEVKIQNLKIVEYKRELNKEKCDKIEKQQDNKVYTLELPKGASKQLAKYILDQGAKSTQALKMWRTGEGFQTKYNFIQASV